MDCLHERELPLSQLMPLIQERLAAGQSVRLSPKGISMLPMLRQGIDSVVLSPVPDTLRKYDLPLYQREDGKYILHRIVEVGKNYSCMGDNQFVTETGVTRDQMIAVVTSFYRKDKRYEVTCAGYRIYCHFWHCSRGIRRFFRRGFGWLRRRFMRK